MRIIITEYVRNADQENNILLILMKEFVFISNNLSKNVNKFFFVFTVFVMYASHTRLAKKSSIFPEIQNQSTKNKLLLNPSRPA